MCADAVVLTQLLVLLPGASDDPGARNALWSILGRIFRQLVTCRQAGSKAEVWGVVSAVAEASSIVAEDLQEHREEDLEEEHGIATSTSRGLEAKLVTVRPLATLGTLGTLGDLVGEW